VDKNYLGFWADCTNIDGFSTLSIPSYLPSPFCDTVSFFVVIRHVIASYLYSLLSSPWKWGLVLQCCYC
jgi:hypothetical protein